MKRIFAIIFVLMAVGRIAAQISPENCSIEHKDSNWYVTLDYEIDKIPSKDGMLLITHLCNPDTCITSAAKHFQGKKYAKQYVKRHGYQPNLHNHGNSQCVIALPEQYASDTLWGITYCEYNKEKHLSMCVNLVRQAFTWKQCYSTTELYDFIHGLNHLFFNGVAAGQCFEWKKERK